MNIWRFLSGNLALLTIVAAVAAYLYPPLFMVFSKSAIQWAFAATMFALGLVLHPEEAKAALKKPGRIAIGVTTQFTVMPLLGFAAGSIVVALGYPPALALGFVIVGCAPGAMASNVITYLAGGAVAFSIAMTMVATMLSPLLTPLLVKYLGGAFLHIPFWPMMQTILLTVVLPLIAGMALRPLLARYQAQVEQIAPGVAALAILLIVGFVTAANADRIASVSVSVLLLVVAISTLGYLGGFAIARLCRFDYAHKVTMTIEIGMQNAGLGVMLALKHFEPVAALPGALFAVWAILTAAGMTRWLHKRSQAIAAV
jgi:BASS family bile acid:Na+ symporter